MPSMILTTSVAASWIVTNVRKMNLDWNNPSVQYVWCGWSLCIYVSDDLSLRQKFLTNAECNNTEPLGDKPKSKRKIQFRLKIVFA